MARMAAQHLRALVAKHAPGRTVTSLEAAAGVPEKRLDYYLNRKIARLPGDARLAELARIIGGECTVSEVFQALLRDVYPETFGSLTGLSSDELNLLADYHRVPQALRPQARAMIEVLARAPS